MNRDKQIKSTDWLTKGYTKEELATMKAEAIKEAEIEEIGEQTMELNAETVRKALDWLDSLVGNSNDSDMAVFTYQLLGILYDTCEEKEQKIFELENRLKECENGYEGTLALERAKIKQLTEEVADLKAIAEGYQKQFEDCANDRARLTEENERLNAIWAKQCVELEERCMALGAEVADLQDELICEKETNAHLGREYMSENHLRYQAEEMLANGMGVIKADTARTIQNKLRGVAFVDATFMGKPNVVTMDDVDRIISDILEGNGD